MQACCDGLPAKSDLVLHNSMHADCRRPAYVIVVLLHCGIAQSVGQQEPSLDWVPCDVLVAIVIELLIVPQTVRLL